MAALRAFIRPSLALALVALFATSTAAQSPSTQPSGPDKKIAADQQSRSGTPENKGSASEPTQGVAKDKVASGDDRYRDGIIIWQTPDEAKVPFLLKFNINTQIRYLNTLGSEETYTDHLGVVREVHQRNDITVNRAMFILGG
jgi:hypothetical protein